MRIEKIKKFKDKWLPVFKDITEAIDKSEVKEIYGTFTIIAVNPGQIKLFVKELKKL